MTEDNIVSPIGTAIPEADNVVVTSYVSQYAKVRCLPTRPSIPLGIKKMHPDAKMPEYAEPGAAGFDMFCVEDVTISPGQTALIDTGIAIELGIEWRIKLEEKSGIGLKTPLILKGGIIDPTFKDSIKVIFQYPNGDAFGHEPKPISFSKGQKIVQGLIEPNYMATFTEVDTLSESERGTGGFGSTGV
jgi:dUTP pyrophosphatase